ncbi:hypothetical protein [Sorangium sp. So ce1389]|uniref:hypothetical protein n=1 Tax=Sorangium sp. So ce1389 TaxID=3133336 RepID=UPI003F5DC870
MDATSDESPKRDQKNQPGERSLVLKVPEGDYRTFRCRAMALGLRNPEFLARLLELEAQHPIR